MKRVFADTVFLFGKVDPQDTHHDTALAAEAALGDAQIVTTDVVLTELLAMSRSDPTLRAAATKLVREMLNSRNVLVVRLNADLFERGLVRYERQRNSAYSLVDCISMEVMKEFNIQEALTADRDFQHAGFTRLMRNLRERLRG